MSSDSLDSVVPSRKPEEEALVGLSAIEVLRLFRGKKLAPSEYLEALLERIEEDSRHPKPLNAFMEVLADEARAKALEADEYYARQTGKGFAARPLMGLPVAAKEKHTLAGRSGSQGMRAHAEAVSETNHVVIDRIQAAGGIIHGRTTSPEFSCATVTHSHLWGVTRNPWNRDLSPGGSSGGSAAAVAAGMAPLATASDIAGSTRIPAAFTGLVGYKGPYGSVPGAGVLAADWYRGDGGMARTVEDVVLLTNVIRGHHSSDHRSIPSPGDFDISYPRAVEKLRGRRIAYAPTLGNYPVETGIKKQLDAAAQMFSDAGASVELVDLPWTTDKIRETTLAHYGHILAFSIKEALIGKEELAEEYTRYFVEITTEYAKKISLLDSLQREHQMQIDLAETMDGFDVLITPASAVRSLEAGGMYLNGIVVPNQADGGERFLEHYWEAHMTSPFNVSNRCPVLCVPAGIDDGSNDDQGFPVGMQIVGHPFDEGKVFEVGAAWQNFSQQLKVPFY